MNSEMILLKKKKKETGKLRPNNKKNTEILHIYWTDYNAFSTI